MKDVRIFCLCLCGLFASAEAGRHFYKGDWLFAVAWVLSSVLLHWAALLHAMDRK